MNTSWVWDFIFNIVLPGIGLGLLGLIVWDASKYLFHWLICRYDSENDENKKEEE